MTENILCCSWKSYFIKTKTKEENIATQECWAPSQMLATLQHRFAFYYRLLLYQRRICWSYVIQWKISILLLLSGYLASILFGVESVICHIVRGKCKIFSHSKTMTTTKIMAMMKICTLWSMMRHWKVRKKTSDRDKVWKAPFTHRCNNFAWVVVAVLVLDACHLTIKLFDCWNSVSAIM